MESYPKVIMLPDTDNLTGIIGDKPNMIWLRVGQALVAFGALSYLGANVAGVSFTGEGSSYAPIVIVLLGFVALYYGTRLARVRVIAERLHELEMADKRHTPRPKPEPTRGHKEFLAFIKPLLPLTIEEVGELEFDYDSKRTKKLLLKASNYQRIGFWGEQGTIRKHGGMYDLRDKPDNNETIYK